jgi:uncharacterized membrane protein YbhN (UPF0104 family)
LKKQFFLSIFKSRAFRLVFSITTIIMTVGILGYLVLREKDTLANYVWTIRWELLPLSFFFYVVSLVFVVVVWIQILESFKVNLKFLAHLRFYCISNLMKRLPGTVWYVAWRMHMYSQNGLSAKIIALASGLEMAIYIISGILVSVIFSMPILIQTTGGVLGIALLLVINGILFHPVIIRWLLKKAGSSIVDFDYYHLLRWVSFYILNRLVGGSILFCSINLFYPLPLEYLGYVIGCHTFTGIFSLVLFFFPTNFGFPEITLSLLLSSILPSSLAVVIIVVNRLSIIFFETIVAVIAYLIDILVAHKLHPSSHENS